MLNASGSRGPKGRLRHSFPILERLEFLQEQGAAKSLLTYLSQPGIGRETGRGERRLRSAGVEKLTTLKTWPRRTAEGTLYHYPIRTTTRPCRISASPARPGRDNRSTVQATLTKMCVRFYMGEAMENTLAWAEGELEGFMRS